jgi:hypothetical protein
MWYKWLWMTTIRVKANVNDIFIGSWEFFQFSEFFFIRISNFCPKTQKRPHVGMSKNLIYQQVLKNISLQKSFYGSPSTPTSQWSSKSYFLALKHWIAYKTEEGHHFNVVTIVSLNFWKERTETFVHEFLDILANIETIYAWYIHVEYFCKYTYAII